MGERAEALRRNPKAVRTTDLVAAMESTGFECRRTANGHWLCRHARTGEFVSFAEPHGKGDSFVKPVYVRRAAQAIEAAEIAGSNDDE
jgi:hypothetical protein